MYMIPQVCVAHIQRLINFLELEDSETASPPPSLPFVFSSFSLPKGEESETHGKVGEDVFKQQTEIGKQKRSGLLARAVVSTLEVKFVYTKLANFAC